MTMASADYGYGDGAPSTTDASKYGYGDDATNDLGYGDAPPDSAVPATDYGYGEAEPSTTDYGYGEAEPSTTDYGYGDAAPDTDAPAPETDYGYGDAAPDTDAPAPETDASKYGYGDDEPAAAAAPQKDYGYGEYNAGYNDDGAGGGNGKPKHNVKKTSNDLGYESTHSTSGMSVESYGSYGDGNGNGNGNGEAPEQPRRQRYRRRGSVTKYSIEETTTQDDCQPNSQREYVMPADNSYNPATYNAKYNSTTSTAAAESGEDTFETNPLDPDANHHMDAHSAAGDGDEGDDDHEHKKKGKVGKMMKGLRSISKRRFSTY
jgi:hypothetical protein